MSLRIGSLFSGYGGLDMAVQDFYGGHVVWYSEIDKNANTILAAHYLGVPNLGDIKTVNWADVPPVDILTGGYPCQPFSHAGSRKGKEDERHLWPYVRDAIAFLRPMVTVLENVDGHRSLGFADVLGDIAKMGMSARWGVIRAADAGAPHGRARIFIVANSDNARWREHSRTIPTKSQFASAQHPSDITADASRRQQSGAGPEWHRLSEPAQCSDLAAADPDGDGYGQQLHAGGVGSVEGAAAGGASQRQRARRESDTGSADPAADADSAGGEARRNTGQDSQFIRIESLGHSDFAADADSDRRGEARGTAQAQADRASGADSGRDRIPAAVDWGRYGPAITRWEQVSGRSAPDPTILGATGRPRLSPIFVEWMMGLPAGHVTGFGLRPSACLKILGNGVVPQQAALALRMLEAS